MNLIIYYKLYLLNILDVNDNVPFFTSSIYEASVTEGADIGTSVLQVSATDLDLGRNGEVSMKLDARLHTIPLREFIYTASLMCPRKDAPECIHPT